MLRKLGVSVQGGGGPSFEIFGPIHVLLNRIFNEHVCSDYFDGLDGMGFLFRLSGPIVDFGSEGVERLFHRKRQKSIEIDIVFPEAMWRELSSAELWGQTEAWLREAMTRMIERGVKDKVIKDADGLKRDFESAMEAFAAERPSG